MNTLPRFEIEPLSDEDGGGYLIRFPDYPGCISDGETPEEAITNGKDALCSYIATHEQLGKKLPTADGYSGKWNQRVPKYLHAALVRRAAEEGVSFNSLCISLLAEGVGRRSVKSSPSAG